MRSMFVCLALVLAACGNGDCQKLACSSSTHSYSVCLGSGTTQTYKYGGTSCSCDVASDVGCDDCSTAAGAYCGGATSDPGGAGTTITDDFGIITDDIGTIVSPYDFAQMSCSLTGTFTGTASGTTRTFTATSTGTYTLVVQSSTTIDIAGTYSLIGATASLTTTASSQTGANACLGDPASYSLGWDTSCATVTFTPVADSCSARDASPAGTGLARQ